MSFHLFVSSLISFINGLARDLLDMTPEARITKQNKQVGLHQTKKLLHSQENNQQSKSATYRMVEYIYIWYIYILYSW